MAIKHLSIPDLTRQDVDRFWGKVKILPSGCWEWQGGLNKPNGYGFNASFISRVVNRKQWKHI